MLRKIDEMHRRFGILPDKRCEDCSNLIKGRYHTVFLRKCTVYGATHSEASDWRKKYVACGMYCKEWQGTEIIKLRHRNGMQIPLEQPLEGQIDLFEQEADNE